MASATLKTVNILTKVFIILSTAFFLSSCSSNRAPVHDRMAPGSNKLTHHTVSRGETLYSIAWRYGLDYKDLARRNGVNRQFTIYPGQKIYLSGTAPKIKSPTKVVKTSTARSSPPRSKTTTKPEPISNKPRITDQRLKWQWPAKGEVLAGFSSQKSLNKGVDINGRLGESVLAAASGVVVYAGSGIRGYGKLLIVKHNEHYLSAYAHNSKLLVREKENVKAGQKIAEIGNSGTDRSKLHFEIRREGKPVDPLQYLPKR
ncbi:peptidoglycan DD-metalloendopeptidase family protein [Aestuariicella sp. G3-2]|uniref:peptidoglycan DD-metalloendopeptidase family protein n=1 Tax=Pseudomaricurvus albidus TaxID=2842452 RepID=UPI001C0CC93D|nr:peptidoglycan DD-metalloendopeptidase family protein [Aestuariicella albida]MBU3070260.1 peptidoglycan DD-metalloendopeptidase family protein [Aestuariicella albida]